MSGAEVMSAARIPDPEDEAALDAIIEKIDDALPKIHERAKDIRASGKTPTQAFRLKNIRATQRRFEDLAEDPLLTDSREDIRLERATDVDEAEQERAANESSRMKIIRLRQRRR